MKKLAVLVGLVLMGGSASAQFFRSNGTGGGLWSSTGSWEQSPDGIGSWVGASSTPTSASNTVVIRSGDNITVSSVVTIDQTTVDVGGTLTVNNTTLTLANTANALVVNGDVSTTGTGAISNPTAANFVFNNASRYIHARNAGAIPLATWNVGSLCTITGITNGALTGGLNQSFHDFTWNSAGQSATISLGGSLTSVAGNLIVNTTNGQQLQLATTPGPTITIGQDLQVLNNSRLAFVTLGTGGVINVGGNFNYYSTNATGSPLKTTGSYILNVTGNFDMNAPGGQLLLSGGNGNTGTMNLTGDFNLAAGTLTETGNGRGVVNFVKSGTQLFTNTATISATIDFSIAASSTLDTQGESPLGGTAGTGTFTLNGTIRLGSLNATGALITGRTAGNVMTNGVRTYAATSKVVYSGLGAQFIGSGQPTTAGVATEIDNASGVTFNTTTSGNTAATILTIPGLLTLTNGNLNIVSTGTARALVLSTDVVANGNFISFSGATSDLTVNGVGDFGPFPFPAGAATLRNFTLNRTGGAGAIQFANDVSITGTTTLTSGTLSFDGQALTLGPAGGGAGGNYSSAGGQLSASGSSTLTLLGSTALASPLNFSPTNNTLTSLTLNKSNAGTSVTISSTLNISSALTITNGQLDIVGNSLVMETTPTPTISVNSAGSIAVSSPSGGPWNLVYSGTTVINPTGFEIPVSGILESLSSTNTSTITLDQSLDIGTGGFTMSSGTFNSGANAISTSFLTISAGTFTAPSSTLTLTSGDLTINGTFTNNAGTLIFGGTSPQTILGTGSASNFRNITVDVAATLTAPATLNIQGDFVNNNVFTAGAGTVNFTGGNIQSVSGTDAQFNNVVVNKASNTVTFNSAQTVNGNFTLTAGTANLGAAMDLPNATSLITLTAGTLGVAPGPLTLADGVTITRAAGVIGTASPTGGPWNVTYTGATKTTGLEIPTTGIVKNLTVNSNNNTTITLAAGQPLTVSGVLTISNTARTFTSGGNNVMLSGYSNAGTFNAPTAAATTGLTLVGTFGTWTPGTFNHNSGTVLIGDGATATNVTMTGASPQLFALRINSLAIFNAPATLNINSRLTNDGTFNAGTGLVNIVSTTSTKTIDGSVKITLNNLTVNSNNTANPDLINENVAGIDLLGILNMGVNVNSTFDADGAANNRILTLLSTGPVTSGTFTTQDASVAQMSAAGGQVTGNVTIQRYMNRQGVSLYNFQVWRNISSPVNIAVSDIQPELPVTGSFTGNDNGAMGTTLTSMFSYSEPVITDTDLSGVADLDDGFVQFPVAANSEAFARGRGYSIFIFGSDEPVVSQNNSKWDVRGPIWSGSFNLPVTFTSSGNIANDGWNLVGNPYPSTIDWTAAGWTKTNVDNAIYMSDYSTANPVFASWVNGVSTNGGTNLIAIGQGFWVKANAAAPVLGITEAVKVAGTQTTFFRTAPPTDLIRVTLSKDNLSDETVIYFTDSATMGYDSKYDAQKFRNPYWYLNLASVSNDQKYAINAMPLTACASQVPLDVSDVVTGTYQLSFTDFESMSSALKIQFRDNFTNSLIDVRQTHVYSFNVDETNPNTFGSNRFSLAFTYEGGLISIASEAPAVCDVTAAVVNVTNSSLDYNYTLVENGTGMILSASIRGTGSLITLPVPVTKIAAGQNTFVVQAKNRYCTNLEVSAMATLNYVTVPGAVITTSGSICGTQGKTTLSASGAPSDGYYHWYDSLDAQSPIPNEIAATFVTPILSASQSYYVAAVNSLGCEGPWVEAIATIANPDPAVIEVVDLFTLRSNYAAGNQWFLNDAPISGATGQTLTVSESGIYRLDVTVSGCVVSINKEMVVTAIEPSQAGAKGIRVYPNPVKEILRVTVDGDIKPLGMVYNLKGALVGSLEFQRSGDTFIGEYGIGKESAGFYFLRIERGNRMDVVKIIKD